MDDRLTPLTSAIDAEALAVRLLGSRRARLGGLQIEHARRVAAATGEDARIAAVALLHDVFETGTVNVEHLGRSSTTNGSPHKYRTAGFSAQ